MSLKASKNSTILFAKQEPQIAHVGNPSRSYSLLGAKSELRPFKHNFHTICCWNPLSKMPWKMQMTEFQITCSPVLLWRGNPSVFMTFLRIQSRVRERKCAASQSSFNYSEGGCRVPSWIEPSVKRILVRSNQQLGTDADELRNRRPRQRRKRINFKRWKIPTKSNSPKLTQATSPKLWKTYAEDVVACSLGQEQAWRTSQRHLFPAGAVRPWFEAQGNTEKALYRRSKICRLIIFNKLYRGDEGLSRYPLVRSRSLAALGRWWLRRFLRSRKDLYESIQHGTERFEETPE